MKVLQKPSKVSKCDATVCMSSNQEQESMDFLIFDDQNKQNGKFSGTPIHNQQIYQSTTQNSEQPWTLEEENKLIELHKQYGNKWTLIARHYPLMCENSIKNRFYSRLRKSIRKLNKVIGTLEIKKYNKFKLNIIFKLSNISEGKMAQKQKIVPQIFHFYREFLYNLIQFSEQNQNFTQTKQSFQNIVNVQNLILPLIALENLFRLVRGQRVAKGKKKNIAYLRQFSFKLSLESTFEMVITKENILFIDNYQNQTLEPNSNHLVQEKTEIIPTNKFSMPSETSASRNRGFKKSDFSHRKESLNLEQSDSAVQSSMDLFKEDQEFDYKTQSSIWKDYLGHEMKEYDICGQGQISLDQGVSFALYSFKSSNFIEDNNMW